MSAAAPIFVISRFRSGSSFLWNLFRQDPRYCCYYEPFHDNLAESVEINLPAMASHRGVSSYWDEYRSIAGDLVALHRPQFGISDLLLRPGDQRPELVRFIRHLMRAAAREGRICVIKCNRLDFRLPWLRANFPDARIVYILRNPRDQWISSVRPHKPELWDRLEENVSYDLPAWIASLAPHWPFLLQGPPRAAYYYSHLLWTLSREFGERYADIKLDFDRDVADEPANLAESLAPFFPPDFFLLPEVKALIKPTRPGLWRKFRTEEWFKELELQSGETLRQAGVHKPAFWRWPAGAKADGGKHHDELRRAIDLALLMFSRHRADLLVHGHQLQSSLDTARTYADSLRAEYEKSRDTLKSTESQRSELDSKHRLLQAVYDSLKQAHDLSLSSLSKTLEEFRYATNELRQLIAYKDAQLLQLTDGMAESRKSLSDAKSEDRLAGLNEQLDGARATIDQLRGELAAIKDDTHEARTLKQHAMALEAASAESWIALTATRKQLAAAEALRAGTEERLRAGQVELDRLAAGERAAQQNLAAAAARAEDQAKVAAAQAAVLGGLQREASARQDTITGLEQEIAGLRRQLAQESADKAALAADLAGARAELDRHRALQSHVTALELAHDEASRQIAGLREEVAGLKAEGEALARAAAAADRALEERAAQLAAISARGAQLEQEVLHLGRQLEQRLVALDAAEAAGRQFAAERDQARRHGGTLENNLATEVRQAAELARKLLAEQTARTTEKTAYDQRTALHIDQLKEAYRLLEAEKAGASAREAELRNQLARLGDQLAAADARMNAIEQSWAGGLVRRIIPVAFRKSP